MYLGHSSASGQSPSAFFLTWNAFSVNISYAALCDESIKVGAGSTTFPRYNASIIMILPDDTDNSHEHLLHCYRY